MKISFDLYEHEINTYYNFLFDLLISCSYRDQNGFLSFVNAYTKNDVKTTINVKTTFFEESGKILRSQEKKLRSLSWESEKNRLRSLS